MPSTYGIEHPYGTSVIQVGGSYQVVTDPTQFPVSSGQSAVVAQAANAAFNAAQSGGPAYDEQKIVESVKGATPSSYAEYLNLSHYFGNVAAQERQSQQILGMVGSITPSGVPLDIRGEPIGTGPTYVSTPQGIATIPAAGSAIQQAYQNIALFGSASPIGQPRATEENIALANAYAGITPGISNAPIQYPGTDKWATEISALPTYAAQQQYAARHDDPLARVSWYQRFGQTEPVTMEKIGEAWQKREDYTPLASLGDTKTAGVEKAYTAKGYDPISARVAALEEQYRGALKTPDKADERFYSGEMQRASQMSIGLASTAHKEMAKEWLPYAGNPFEAMADTYLEVLKGYPTKGAEGPLSFTTPLPVYEGKPMGIQEVLWSQAVQSDKGKAVTPFEGTYQPAIQLATSRMGQIYEGIAVEGPLGPYAMISGAPYKEGMTYFDKAGVRIEPTALSTLGRGAVTEEIVTTPSQFAGVGPTIVQKAQKGGGADYGVSTPYVPSESIMLPQKTTIDVGTVPIVGMFAAPVAGAFGLKTDIEAGPLGAFFNPPVKETTKAGTPIALPEVIVPGETTVRTTPTGYEITSTETKYGGEITPYTTTQEVAGKSGYEQFKQNIRDVLQLPTPEVGEKAVQLTAVAMPVIGVLTLPSVIAEAKGDKEAARYTGMIEPLKGQYAQFYEEPVLVPISAGVGTGFGVLSKGVESAYMGSRALAAEKIISEGGVYRAAEQFGSAIVSRAPTALGALYGADILSRSTEGFKSYEPSAVAAKARGIVLQEAVPMGIGFGVPETTVRAAKLSDIGYKSALQEGVTTGRLQYYVTEPVSRPFELAKIDYKSYVQEAAPRETGVPDYLMSKISTQARIGEISAKSYAQESKDAAARAIESVSSRVSSSIENIGKVMSGEKAVTLESPLRFVRGVSEKPITREYSRKYVTPEEEYAFVYPEGTSMGKQIGLANIAVKSFIQEGGVSKGLTALGKVGHTTYGETPIAFAGVTTPFKEPGAPSITKGKPPEGGTGKRVTQEKVIGGRVVSGLAAEPSLKAMGISEKPSGLKGRQTFRSVDFRGKPSSERMKPMDLSKTKQAAGQGLRLLTEELPSVEGMTQGKVTPRPVGVIPVIIPRTEFANVRVSELLRRELGVIESAQMQRAGQERVSEEALKRRMEFTQSLGVKPISEGQTKQEQQREVLRETRVTQMQTPSLKIDVIPTSKVTQKQTVRQVTTATRITTPRETTITTPRITKVPQKTMLKVPGTVPTIPYGGGGAGARGERGRRFTKELRVGTGIGWIDIAGTRRRPTRKK